MKKFCHIRQESVSLISTEKGRDAPNAREKVNKVGSYEGSYTNPNEITQELDVVIRDRGGRQRSPFGIREKINKQSRGKVK